MREEGAVGQGDADLSRWRFEHLHTVGGQTWRDTELRVVRPPRRGKLYTEAMVGISSAPALRLTQTDKPKGCRRSGFDH